METTVPQFGRAARCLAGLRVRVPPVVLGSAGLTEALTGVKAAMRSRDGCDELNPLKASLRNGETRPPVALPFWNTEGHRGIRRQGRRGPRWTRGQQRFAINPPQRSDLRGVVATREEPEMDYAIELFELFALVAIVSLPGLGIIGGVGLLLANLNRGERWP